MLATERLSLALGGFSLSDVSLEVEKGQYAVILGPTGAGKTVLLETIAGLHRPRSGRILINGESVEKLPPERRNLGVVYQDCALFPHMTVLENIEFGPMMRKAGLQTARRRACEAGELVGVAHLFSRSPKSLSGGEKQRVAIARALAVEPYLLLLDEPLSALDRHNRDLLCRELKRIHAETGVTVLHVTHDLDEAFFLADRIAIMDRGAVVQQGEPLKIRENPASETVARLVGICNFIWAELSGDTLKSAIGEIRPARTPAAGDGKSGLAAVSPWGIEIDPADLSRFCWSGVMSVADVGFTESRAEVELSHPGGVTLRAFFSRREFEKLKEKARPGNSLKVGIRADGIHCIFSAKA